MPTEKKAPKEPFKKKRKPRPILWQPSREQDEVIRQYQAFQGLFGRRPTRAAAASRIMRLGFASWEHQRAEWNSNRLTEEESQPDDGLTGQERMDALLARIKAKLPELENWLQVANGWPGEDGIYRFYHQSFKVFAGTTKTLSTTGLIDRSLQHLTRLGFDLLEAVAGGRKLHPWFLQIYQHGQVFKFNIGRSNAHWLEETRPILESFWHVRYFVEQMIKYGKKLEEAPDTLPSGWAAVLYLYCVRQTNFKK